MMKRAFVSIALFVISSTGLVREVMGGSLQVADAYLGVLVDEVTPEVAKRLNLREERGALVTDVVADSPAAKAGLRKNDVIIRWNDLSVESAMQLVRLLRETPAERIVKLMVVREGRDVEVNVKLAARSERMPISVLGRGLKRGYMGADLMGLTPQLAQYFGLPDASGALVVSVKENTPAARAGLKAGDVILSIGGEKVNRPSDVSRILWAKAEMQIEVKVMRNKQEQTLTLQLEKTERRPGLILELLLESPGMVMPEMEGFVLRLPEITIPPIQLNLPPFKLTAPRIDIPRLTPFDWRGSRRIVI
jgi:serine protease Do